MSETELSVICKNCGSEVSPYVTECPYCGARLRKRAPKLERRGDALEPRPKRRGARLRGKLRSRAVGAVAERPYATATVVAVSAILLIIQKATGATLSEIGGLVVPFDNQWWRLFTAPFAYVDVGYLFVVAIALVIFAGDLERRLGTFSVAVLLVACGALGMLAATGVAEAEGRFTMIAGGNGMALGAIAAWFAIRRADSRRSIDEDYDLIGVAVAAAVILLLPLFDSSADVFAGLAGGAVGGLAGLAASVLRPSE
jgi:membrane associated rhomboid family serine protease